jgi:5-methylcytosine-specific restriction endonuclease McrA
MKAYQKGEKYQAWRKAFKNSQEYKEWYKAYSSTPEYKARDKFHKSKPEYKAKERIRWEIRKKTPEYKAKFKIIDKARQSDPRYKAIRKKMSASRRHAKSVIPLTKEEHQQLVVLEQKRLHLTETTGIMHHLDHIVPLAKGGIHHPINCRVITAEENCSKSDKMTPEAMALIPQIQAIVHERKGWLNKEQDSTLADLFTTDEDET